MGGAADPNMTLRMTDHPATIELEFNERHNRRLKLTSTSGNGTFEPNSVQQHFARFRRHHS
jgi:hypothetical protein